MNSLGGKPSATFSATVRFSNSVKCWNTMPMPSVARLGWTGEDNLLSHPAQLAAARLDQAVHHLDKGRLAGAVLAEKRMDLGREQVEIDAVVGEKISVPFAYGNGTQQRAGPRRTGWWRRIKHGNRCAYPSFARLLAEFFARIVPSSSGRHAVRR